MTVYYRDPVSKELREITNVEYINFYTDIACIHINDELKSVTTMRLDLIHKIDK